MSVLFESILPLQAVWIFADDHYIPGTYLNDPKVAVITAVFLQYCNVYVALPKLRQLLTNTDLQKECLDYVGLQGASKLIKHI